MSLILLHILVVDMKKGSNAHASHLPCLQAEDCVEDLKKTLNVPMLHVGGGSNGTQTCPLKDASPEVQGAACLALAWSWHTLMFA